MASCDVQALLNSAVCFDCLSDGAKQTVELVLLSQIAGVSNPQTLLSSAACFDCLSDGLKETVELQLLCDWSS